MNRLLERILWKLFPLFEKLGIHVLPVHFYSPVPDMRQLRKNMHLFNVEHPMYGIDMPHEDQIDFLRHVVKSYEAEYIKVGINSQFGIDASQMPTFAPLNALVLYAIIRHYKPKRMIEVGSGTSTKISAVAFKQNSFEGVFGEFTAIEPYPSHELKKGYEGLKTLIQKRVEDVPIKVFQTLRENDILFIDSSHTVKIFGDVNFLFLTVLPRLQPGVIIHIHDIFFPFDYLPHHFFNKGAKQIWQEQYLLHAFLMFNKEFRVLLCSSYIHFKYKDRLREIFPWYHFDRCPSSFLMQRVLK